MDGGGGMGQDDIVRFERVDDRLVLIQGPGQDSRNGEPSPDAHPHGRLGQALEEREQQVVAASPGDGVVKLPVELDELAGALVTET